MKVPGSKEAKNSSYSRNAIKKHIRLHNIFACSNLLT